VDRTLPIPSYRLLSTDSDSYGRASGARLFYSGPRAERDSAELSQQRPRVLEIGCCVALSLCCVPPRQIWTGGSIMYQYASGVDYSSPRPTSVWMPTPSRFRSDVRCRVGLTRSFGAPLQPIPAAVEVGRVLFVARVLFFGSCQGDALSRFVFPSHGRRACSSAPPPAGLASGQDSGPRNDTLHSASSGQSPKVQRVLIELVYRFCRPFRSRAAKVFQLVGARSHLDELYRERRRASGIRLRETAETGYSSRSSIPPERPVRDATPNRRPAAYRAVHPAPVAW